MRQFMSGGKTFLKKGKVSFQKELKSKNMPKEE